MIKVLNLKEMIDSHKVKSKTCNLTQKIKEISKHLSWSKKGTYAKTINVNLWTIVLRENFDNGHL